MTSTPGSPADPNDPQGPPAPPTGYGIPPQPAAEGGAGQPAPEAGRPDQPEHRESRPAGFDDRGRVRRGRVSATWIGIIAATIVLILLIVFIAQNLNKPTIHFLGASGKFPLGLLVLLSAIAGVIITAIPGTVRILQLRKALKKNTPLEQRRPANQG